APRGAAKDRLATLHALVEVDPRDTFCLYGLAQEYARRGDVDEALRWYDRCIATDENYCYAYFHKARALEEAGRNDEAIGALRIGLVRANASGDRHAASEIAGYLDQLT
ncbi:MAG: tetratricopeptide repeat protein, partial [Phycisphaerae bacterium]|nr:tetratricopeptide repeat protein [Phycisphaerae bacterium]